MAVAPVVVPELGILALVTIGLGALLAWATLRGLRFSWLYTIGYLMEQLAAALDFSVLGRAVRLGGPIRRANHRVLNALETGAAKVERKVGYLFHACALILAWQARELEGLAHDVLAWAQSLRHVTIPRLTRAMIIAAFPLPWLARRVAALVRAHVIPATRTTIHSVTHVVTTRVVRVVKATAGAVAIPLPHIRVFPRLRELGQQIGRTRKQVRRLAYFTTATGAAVLVAKAFSRMGLNWLRCRNVSKVGRGICRMDLGVLNFLLGTATAVFALSHLCELVGYIQRATALALPSILALVNETEGYVCGGSKSLPTGIVATDGKRVAAFPTGVSHP